MSPRIIAIRSNPIPTTSTALLRHRNNLFTALTSPSTSLAHLKQLHAQVLRSGFVLQASALFDSLVSSFTLSPTLNRYFLEVSSQIAKPDTAFCNQLLRTFSHGSEPEKTLFVYEIMRREGLGVDEFSFAPLLKGLSKKSSLIIGMEVHGFAAKFGFDSDQFVQTDLIGMYSTCGRIFDARLMFDRMPHRDIVVWSIMLDGYCKNALFNDASLLYEDFRSLNMEPDGIILSTVIFACSRAANLDHGKAIHKFITEKNLTVDSRLQTALVIMYANCGSMDMAQQLYTDLFPKNLVVSTIMVSGHAKLGNVTNAREIFDQMTEKDLVCWSAMISCYSKSHWPQEALNLFSKMQAKGIKPDEIILLSIISACAHLGSLEKAKWVHLYADEIGFGGTLYVNNALIDMYAKCGSLEKAKFVFEGMPRRDAISWTSMINAFGIHGDGAKALEIFHQAKKENVNPTHIMFVGVLYACSLRGLVNEARNIFASMFKEYKIIPELEHYACMVDMFGRANLFQEALEVIETMPMVPNIVIWVSLLANCRVHGESELGEFAAKRVLELDPGHDGALALLANIYGKGKRWGDVVEVKKMTKETKGFKERGFSRIEVDGEMHEFAAADWRHRNAGEVYKRLDEVVKELKVLGYSKDSSEILVEL